MPEPFRFKQFSVAHDRCAMKIGTDGVLLGAWASLDHDPKSILDVGAGSGIISLQLAQRALAETIDAVEIEPNAYEQCVENFENSLWNDRLFCYHASFSDFVKEIDTPYDLIVSNPPFYNPTSTSHNKPITDSREKARQNVALPFYELIAGAVKLMSPKGQFALIIPKENEAAILRHAKQHRLYLQNHTDVKGTDNTPVKRSLLQFGFQKTTTKSNVLVIEKSRHNYTDDYINLVKDFYLKM